MMELIDKKELLKLYDEFIKKHPSCCIEPYILEFRKLLEEAPIIRLGIDLTQED